MTKLNCPKKAIKNSIVFLKNGVHIGGSTPPHDISLYNKHKIGDPEYNGYK